MLTITVLLFLAVWLVLTYLCYRLTIPTPIPGIPHLPGSAKKPFGDVPAMLLHVSKTEEIFSWMTAQCSQLDSPIIQLFIRPFGGPKVVLCDFRESQDIMTRRLQDFDRSDFFGDVFGGLLPDTYVHMPSNETQKYQRRLMGGSMTSASVNEVAAPQFYGATVELLQLWRAKISLAPGHPFAASEDILHLALDAIFASAFATTTGATKSQMQLLESLSSLKDLPLDNDVPAVFPKAPTPPTFNCVVTLADSMIPLPKSPAPRLHHWFIRKTPSYRKAEAYKSQLLSERIAEARKKFVDSPKSEKHLASALDHLFQRETVSALKENREPKYDTPVVRDELLTYLIAGHETIATTVVWGLKLLTDHPATTDTLRNILYSSLPTQDSDSLVPSASPSTLPPSRPPTPAAEIIAKTSLPYLEAVMEEILRLSGTVPGTMRKAVRDTEILGYHIPRGTDVFLMSNGPGFLSPPLRVDERSRAQTSRDAKEGRGEWDVESMSEFRPERWLRDGVFDGKAGPTSQFGSGPRACFGKVCLLCLRTCVEESSLTDELGRRLAYMELRIMLTLIVWHFRLLRCPAELSSYAATDRNATHHPQQCYVRLETL